MNNVIKESLKLTLFFFLVVTYRLIVFKSRIVSFCSIIWIFPLFSISPVITPSSHCLLLYWCPCLQTPLEFSKCGSWSSNITIKPHSLWECSISSPTQTFGIMSHVSHHAVCLDVMLPSLLTVYAWSVCICSASRIFPDSGCSHFLFCKRQLTGEGP